MINVEKDLDVELEQLKHSIALAEKRGEGGLPIPIGLMEQLINTASESDIVKIDPYASLAVDSLRLFTQNLSYAGHLVASLPTEMLTRIISIAQSQPINTSDVQIKGSLVSS